MVVDYVFMLIYAQNQKPKNIIQRKTYVITHQKNPRDHMGF